jgi:DNA (cytosine-5)-methyltransferase 1
VDLFSGCGGLTLGLAQACFNTDVALEIALAVDFEASATAVYQDNFPAAERVVTDSIESLFDRSLTGPLTEDERQLAAAVGQVDVLVGGPPCQGHSNLNNHTRRNDPKNDLYSYMARAAKAFSPQIVLIENVPAVLHDKFGNANVVQTVKDALVGLGFQVDDQVVQLKLLGVAQTRKRHILLATKVGLPSPKEVFDSLKLHPSASHDLRWAIGDLENVSPVGWDKPPVPNAINLERMAYLESEQLLDLPNEKRPKCHQGEHSYKSMYGRLSWDAPAQTLTSGFGSIGQGRYMHPSKLRALTAHEAARIQGFPDYFSFESIEGRGRRATMIGNAVPPQLACRILGTLISQLELSQSARGDQVNSLETET